MSEGPSFPKQYKGPKKAASLQFPATLLDEIDAQAELEGISRNQFIVYGMSWVVEKVKEIRAKKQG